MGYFIYFTGTSILFNLDIPLIGDKLSIYQEATEKGIGIVEMELFNPVYPFKRSNILFLTYISQYNYTEN